MLGPKLRNGLGDLGSVEEITKEWETYRAWWEPCKVFSVVLEEPEHKTSPNDY